MNPIAEIDAKLRAGSYAPALATVISSLRAGRHPSPLEFGALLFENGTDRAQARALVAQYQTAPQPNAEDALMASLRAFNLPRD